MDHTTLFKGIHLIGLSLPSKTTNENGKSNRDCGNLWQQFEKEGYAAKIPDKLTDEIFAVYHQYEGDHTRPFAYFIGCKVKSDTAIPQGMDSLIIPGGTYQKFTASGKMPDCIAHTWKEIWESDINRAYHTDFEIYGPKSQDWNHAEVDVFVSVK